MPLLRVDRTVWEGYLLLVLGKGAEKNKGGAPTAGVDQKAPGITFMSRTIGNPQMHLLEDGKNLLTSVENMFAFDVQIKMSGAIWVQSLV